MIAGRIPLPLLLLSPHGILLLLKLPSLLGIVHLPVTVGGLVGQVGQPLCAARRRGRTVARARWFRQRGVQHARRRIAGGLAVA